MQRDYCVLMRARSQSHPLLAWGQSYLPFLKARHVAVEEPVKLTLGEPVPSRPIMVDHHSLPQPVLSCRVKDMLEPLDLYGAQFVPADVHVGEAVLRYWLLHLWQRIPCVDRVRSVVSLDDEDGDVVGIDKLVLDEERLGAVPLAERLVFRLEKQVVHLFHHTVVDRVLSLTPPPEGLRFIPVPDWNDSAGFR